MDWRSLAQYGSAPNYRVKRGSASPSVIHLDVQAMTVARNGGKAQLTPLVTRKLVEPRHHGMAAAQTQRVTSEL